MHSLAYVFFATAFLSAPGFDDAFTGKTLRFDYYHSGTAAEEHVSLDKIRGEGDWPGSRTHLLDDTNLGKYLFVVMDTKTNLPIYSRGFASIYGEWETTGEAGRGLWRTFHESQRFPEPRGTCQLVLKKRGDDGSFRELYAHVIDPASRFVDRAPVTNRGRSWSVFENGPVSEKVDLLVLGDGYTSDETDIFHQDVERLVSVLFETEPFRARRKDFNVWAVDAPSEASGITQPRDGKWVRSPLGLSSNAFDSERYVLTYANERVREIAALAPYDAVVLIANTRKYGGGGIFNLWATTAAHSSQADYIFVHEFGHSFAGLADEYYTSQVAYEDFNPVGSEPWEPNVTAFLDPDALKWKDLLAPGTPLPTPWSKAEYEKVSLAYQEKRRALRQAKASETELEALFEEVERETTPILEGGKFAGKVGLFEGAAYRAKGLFRSESDCIMFSRNPRTFCRVCSRAIERMIDLYSR